MSYFEWVQNRSGDVWEEEYVISKLKKIMENALTDLMQIKEQYNVCYREAAFILGVERIVTTMKLRGRI